MKTVLWLCDNPNWAYAARVEQLKPSLPDYEHDICYVVADGVANAKEHIKNADIVVCMYVRYMDFVEPLNKVVVNLGGMRPFEKVEKPDKPTQQPKGKKRSLLSRLRAYFGIYTVLSIENSLRWSWGNVIVALMKCLRFVRFIRVERFQHTYRTEDGKDRTAQAPIAANLSDYFDVTLLQNVDSIRLMRGDKKRAVVRIGGMTLGTEDYNKRYDDQLSEVGAVIACNTALFEIGRRANPNTCMIPNGCDIDNFCPAKDYLSDERLSGDFTVGFVGNVWGAGATYKGWKFYVKATEIELALEVKRKNLLHGQNDIPNEEMPAYFQSIDALVMPSQGEGCSNTIKEALACGVPVLITKVGFHGEMLRDGETCLFIERDAKDIAEKILLLKNDIALRKKLALNGRLFAEMYHDVRKIAAHYDKIFKQVIKRS